MYYAIQHFELAERYTLTYCVAYTMAQGMIHMGKGRIRGMQLAQDIVESKDKMGS